MRRWPAGVAADGGRLGGGARGASRLVAVVIDRIIGGIPWAIGSFLGPRAITFVAPGAAGVLRRARHQGHSNEEGGGQAQERRLVGGDADEVGAAGDLAADPLLGDAAGELGGHVSIPNQASPAPEQRCWSSYWPSERRTGPDPLHGAK
jgi:hypothetical protein